MSKGMVKPALSVFNFYPIYSSLGRECSNTLVDLGTKTTIYTSIERLHIKNIIRAIKL